MVRCSPQSLQEQNSALQALVAERTQALKKARPCTAC